MEFFDRLRSHGIYGRLSARVRALSKRDRASPHSVARLKRFRKRLGGLALLLVAVTLGFWAQDFAESVALSGWLRSHPPSELMWRHALLSRGMKELKDAHALQKAVKTLPSLVDEDGRVWATADFGWIAVFVKQSSGIPQAVYCLECDHGPQGWAPLGNGWDTFDPVMAGVDRMMAGRRITVVKKAVARDPREIVF